MLVAMGIGMGLMGATMMAVTDAMRANEIVIRITGVNNTLRAAMDLMVRDLLQVGAGLPPAHVILNASGAGSALIRIPGPPGTAFTNVAGDPDMAAVIPGTGLGPVVNGVATDVITVLTADNNFTDVGLTAVTGTTVDVAAGINLTTGPDRVTTGQLMMIAKGSHTTLVQVTGVNGGTRRLTFAVGDSLVLNQPAAAAGTLAALNAAAPANTPASTRITRVRMISYYIDATIAGRPRLVRRINNGHPTTFNNTLGTMVGSDIENLQLSYDLTNGTNNPAGVRFTAADLAGGTVQCPNPCSPVQVRKINIVLTARSSNASDGSATPERVFRNTLTSQVSLRGMAFVNEYQ